MGGSGSFRFRVGVSVSYSYFRRVRNFDFVYTAAVSVPLAIRGDPGKRNQLMGKRNHVVFRCYLFIISPMVVFML